MVDLGRDRGRGRALDDPAEKAEFLESLGLEETGLARVIRAGYALLDLITFFTAGPKEARAWTDAGGTTAPQAAGVIHTDFEKGFIRRRNHRLRRLRRLRRRAGRQGINAHIRGVVDRFAEEGYSVIAPALFDRVERDVWNWTTTRRASRAAAP